MIFNYRFPDSAIWHKAVYSDDNEQMRAHVQGIEFDCVEYILKGKGKSARADGVVSHEVRMALKTADDRAEQFNSDDRVEFKNQRYFIDRVEPIRSNAYLGAKEYVIYLK